MGLGDIAHNVGDVSSRRDIENHTADRRTWKRLLAYHPHMAYTFCDYTDKEEVKMFVEVMDDVLMNGLDGDKMSEDQLEEIKRQRDDLIDEL